MERSRRSQTSCLLVCGLVAALLSQNFVFLAASSSFQDEKNFYFPPIDPNVGSPPVALSPPIVPSPPIGYGPYGTPPPTRGSGGSTPPVHHTPSHGGGGHHHHGGSPPVNCGNPTPHHSPPKHVDPSPVPPTPSTGHHNPSPAPPTGGYHYYPPPSNGGSVPSSPPIVLPPTTPGIPFPSSPPFDPHSPPVIGGTCEEGTASLLNSMVNKNFPFTTSHVRDSFVAAVGSNKAATAQARVFKLANEGHMKPRV
ncbi:hypothetical protein Ccrd_002072 [Cynara cardunculus var. scolymus]|uniref:Uncharacterized protein n=1 Tax=Cynara cardunculus var. scolymus TaxID=59895 RepID=A0A103XS26_CYNCS|nr:hypothetical protein Ccrd_002072 [Cynara cardunculus var. scolymus]